MLVDDNFLKTRYFNMLLASSLALNALALALPRMIMHAMTEL